jgi:hypothetical protein
MTLHWTFDPVTGIWFGWLHPEGPQHIHQDPLGDRYHTKREYRMKDGSEYFTVSLTRYRSAGARVGQFDSLAAAQAAAQAHADALVPA